MTTDKELADAYRLTANDMLNPVSREMCRDRANALDPPKPKWTDGQWVQRDGLHYQWSESDGAWRLGGDCCSLVNDNDVHDPQPLRVLGDDEIAVPRHSMRDLQLCQCQHSNCSLADLMLQEAIAALDAEAGDR